MDPQAAQPQQPVLPGKKILIGVVSLLVIAVLITVTLILIKGAQPNKSESKVTTGLSRDSITIGKNTSVLGVFPSSTPELQDLEFNSNIFDGLTRVINGKVSPALAKSWTNPDKTTWRFYLRTGVKFHNGDPFTAADVKFSVDQALNPKNEWPDAYGVNTVESVSVVNDYTVDIKTTKPDPVLLSRLVTVYIVSEKQYKSKKPQDTAVGTGPYKFVSLDDKTGILEANSSYYLGAPKVRRIVYKYFPEEATEEDLIAALKKGDVDLITLRMKPQDSSLASEFQIKSIYTASTSWLYLDAMRQKSPYVDKTPNPLTNKLVRQAIYKAIDVNQVIKEAGLSAEPASQLVAETVFGYNPNITRPKRSVEEAKKLLKEAGAEAGFTFTLDTPATSEKVGNVIADNLKDINITVKVNIVTKEIGLPKMMKGDSSAFILGNASDTLDSGDIFSASLHTPTKDFGGDNLLAYSNPELDKLAEEASSIFEPKERLPKLKEAMVKAMEGLPIIPLYNLKQIFITRNNFDWTPTAQGLIYCNEITGREVTTK
jgi:peptide/nickel transport system substrate-binding protein